MKVDVPLPANKVAQERQMVNQEHLSTDHLIDNLKVRTISSGAVTVSAQGVKFFLNLVSVMILARLLTPRDFGLVAMVTTVTSFLRVFKDAGLSTATVQREGITQAQVSNLFWINIGVSVVSSTILALAAPVIAWFYRNPKLIGITLLLSATFILSGSTVQHQALLKRQMRFTALALIEVGSMTVGVIVAVVMALLGCRYWSLVGASLSTEG
jgi:O-antigen/teichoic acid export membrane protein